MGPPFLLVHYSPRRSRLSVEISPRGDEGGEAGAEMSAPFPPPPSTRCSLSTTMAPITDHYTPVGHPFYQYLVAPLPAYELGLSFVPVPKSESSSDWETDSVLRSFTAIARRMYTAEETIAAIKASRSSSPESKKCCNVGDNPPISSTSSSSSRSDGAEANGSIGQTATSTPPFIGTPSSSVENSPSTMDNNGHHHHPHRVDKDVEMFNADANAEAESETTPQMQQPRGRNGLRRVALEHLAQGGRQPEGQADRAAVCAADVDCGERTQPSLRQEPVHEF
ncbi:uncharacterized protein B0H18DRAFT_68264 [Fomitopsis serialis]|uniref:uncharacterized protein n=1 Tax=Fomitopsis serialis TaxID=139415 RepID=UPI0020072346|nr:uncharacterized protein B0H18DRAFT_68264 [Neoantrodia serialis]KAH9931825.1 hypothetical protein B0H18DRAFT_68264 [Neoantrodia serialis]